MRKITRKRMDAFLRTNASENLALDIGAGATSYKQYFPNRTTLDIDPNRKPDVIADAHSLPFADNTYEVVLCIDMLEHTLDPQKIIDECYRVLKPGGKIVFVTRFIYPFHDAPGDYWRFTQSSLARIFTKFSSIHIEPEGKEFFTIGVLLQRIVLQCMVRGGKATKALLLFVAWICEHLDWLITVRYGNITRTVEVSEMMASGYYITAQK